MAYDFHKSFEAVGNAFQTALIAIEPTFRQMAGMVHETGLVQYECAKVVYLEHHGTLPGSERTARLRKKRYAKVMRWYLDVYARQMTATYANR